MIKLVIGNYGTQNHEGRLMRNHGYDEMERAGEEIGLELNGLYTRIISPGTPPAALESADVLMRYTKAERVEINGMLDVDEKRLRKELEYHDDSMERMADVVYGVMEQGAEGIVLLVPRTASISLPSYMARREGDFHGAFFPQWMTASQFLVLDWKEKTVKQISS